MNSHSHSRSLTAPAPTVTVIVIGYDDAVHVADAVRSALVQGPAVREVIAVDDCSTDGSGALLDSLAAHEPRLTVVHRETNSGGCGTPRNDGIDRASSSYVMFLDSDDVLPPGAVDALLDAAGRHGAQVAAGLCVRRELPSGHEVPWQPELYAKAAVIAGPDRHPRLVHDTLCVNKLYRTDFLREHGIRFPDGRFVYEDFVFTARVLAASPRLALIPDRVYLWHVRRTAEKLSLSLDRSGIANWQARLDAHRQSVTLLLDASHKRLARAARSYFLDHSLRMYARELDLRGPGYRAEWWTRTRAYLESFDTADFEAAPAPGRVIGRLILASPAPRDLPRVKEIAARPARLLPPYARAPDGTPVWSPDLPQVSLEHLLHRPMDLLPVTVDGELRPRARGTRLKLLLHELYGRVADAGPRTVDVELVDRRHGTVLQRRTATFAALNGGGAEDELWLATALLDLSALGRPGTCDIRLRLHFADGSHRDATPHAVRRPGLLHRTAVPSRRHALLLAHPHATYSGALALRTAAGWRGALSVARRRVARLLH
ncbi:glycosyltransferase [Streptomyces kunmingensis]|uniref:Glycosyltransferase n=1 Tax=Streptomyces kunmingensis TaxID=68225 RepID=A0ABU6CKJ1_9ACTN|nr:glycosyltransferase family 2 protein [Streptomyces kunmingensis]MEB3965233.1 glycosyltransferase [Streptomyces kunmingensis]